MKYSTVLPAALTVWLIVSAHQARSTPFPYPEGTVLVSRNWREWDNTSFGYWNHLAIYVGNQQVVESQEPHGVVLTSLVEYWARPYSRIVAVVPDNGFAGTVAASRAKTMLGMPWRPYVSVGPGILTIRTHSGANCVSVIEEAYRMRNLDWPDRMFYARGFKLPVYMR